ncbi:MAG TPA: TonB-dependent receptor, partial [Smithella sp.]|nr:TonB-dependent receptor [Smithella sp.]
LQELRRGKHVPVLMLTALCVIAWSHSARAAGLFGTPQPLSVRTGGLNTAAGYMYHEDIYESDLRYVVRQHQIYSQAAYGAKDIWEIYGRIGTSDLSLSDAFASADLSTTTGKEDFQENWKFFGTLGAKIFYPAVKFFGLGAFVQGTYHFSYFTDAVAGEHGGIPFEADLKVRNLWEVHGGLGAQITLPGDIRLYGGPYVYYSEAKAALSADIAGLAFSGDNHCLKNKSAFGGYAGADIPLAGGFRLNLEGRYAERFSVGAAVSYVY